jgi:RNA polymerase sigma-70 factor (ECF subfamily)
MADANDHPPEPLQERGPCGPGAETPPLLAELYAKYGDELRRFVLGVVRNHDLTDDILQTVYTRILERGHQARAETLKGWMFQVAFHESLKARRSTRAGEKATRGLAALGFRQGATPDEGLIREETIAKVRKALDKLPAEQRQAVWEKLHEGKTFAQIAEETGLPMGTVITRMRLALQKIRRSLQSGE